MDEGVRVHFFGKFFLENGTEKLDEQTIHSKKIIRLLAYFLLNCDRMISGEELGELIWGNGGSTNPLGALKNLVYRLRNTLKTLGKEEYILSRSGTYGWNKEIEVHSDMKEFEYLAEQAGRVRGNIQEKIEKYEQAIACYRTPETSALISESWLAVRFTYYYSLYLKMARELCELYEEVKAYDKVQNICRYALSCDELNEDAHYWLIRSWVELGDIDNALKQYNTSVRILYEKLGVHRSQKMQELYEDIICMSNGAGYATIDDIYDDIRESDPNGVFFCEYTIFREIYRLEARRVLRSGNSEYMILMTVSLNEQQTFDPARFQYYKKKAMLKLQRILMKNLRMGDVAARYNEEQYIVMLPYCDYESSQKVVQRIMTNFKKEMGSKNITIKAEMREVSVNYDLPPEHKGGATQPHDRKK